AGWSEGFLEGVCLHQLSVMPDIELECVDVVEVLSELVNGHSRPVLPVNGEMVQPMETEQDPQGGGCSDLTSNHRNNPTAESHLHPKERSGRNRREGGVDGHGVVTGLSGSVLTAEKQQLPPFLRETVRDRAPEHSGTEFAGCVVKPRSRGGQCPKAISPWPMAGALAQYVSLSAGTCELPLTQSSGESPASPTEDRVEMVTSTPGYSQVWNVGSGQALCLVPMGQRMGLQHCEGWTKPSAQSLSGHPGGSWPGCGEESEPVPASVYHSPL
ncbi:hypothetical protein chiPu_0026660, partial [Chiloscyllium punctatum]|nr:hypothetical protein [Chiloscyllium punctatum]